MTSYETVGDFSAWQGARANLRFAWLSSVRASPDTPLTALRLVRQEPAMMDVDLTRFRRRGPSPLDATDKRTHCVSVRLNVAELRLLDALRGRYPRGEWMRMAGIGKLPPTIPELNLKAWAVLATAVSNLNQYQAAINQGNAHAIPSGVLEALRDQVQSLRLQLIGTADSGSGEHPDEGHE
ncbi:hypothetical protein JKG47_19265 [Acidithiobacillus sp. MC6.1]|nr:hypothetical protein [Acidithiobacillus sp. MC6.1]